MAYIPGYGELEPLSTDENGNISVRLPDGRVINAASQGYSEGSAPTYALQNPFSEPSYAKQNGQWGYSDPLMEQFYGPMQQSLAPNTLRALDMVPDAMAQQPISRPDQMFGFGVAGAPTTDMMLGLHQKFGGLEGYRSPYEIASDYKKNYIGNDLGLNYTWMNAPGFTFNDILKRYMGQDAIAKAGFNYDALNQGGRVDQFVEQLNNAGIADAFKRNEAGKKSGFGGMVKGWASSPGGSLILGTALGPVLGHAFNPAVSGPMSGIGQSVSNMAGAFNAATSGIPSWLKGPFVNAGKAAITGGNPLTAALTSGLGQFGGFMSNLAGLPPELGNMLAKQGYGAYRQNQMAQRYRNMLAQRRGVFPQRRIG